jgi:hypothetical protein
MEETAPTSLHHTHTRSLAASASCDGTRSTGGYRRIEPGDSSDPTSDTGRLDSCISMDSTIDLHLQLFITRNKVLDTPHKPLNRTLLSRLPMRTMAPGLSPPKLLPLNTGARIPIDITGHEFRVPVLFEFRVEESVSVAADDAFEEVRG